jgi:hypothetical protein
MTTAETLDPLIHAPARLRIVATLAALTHQGRAALDAYTATLRGLLDGL